MHGEGGGAVRVPLHLLPVAEDAGAEELAPVAAVLGAEEAVVEPTPAGVARAVDVGPGDRCGRNKVIYLNKQAASKDRMNDYVKNK